MRSLRIAFAAVVVLFAGTVPAGAATVSVVDGQLRYDAAPGESNAAFLRAGQNGDVVVIEYSLAMTMGDGCAATAFDPDEAVSAARCSGATTARFDLGDGDDGAGADDPAVGPPMILLGGEGSDFLIGGPGADTLDGGGGPDFQIGGAGDDALAGGSDDDSLYGDVPGGDTDTGGADSLDGGPGDDSLAGGPGADAIAGGDGTDTVGYSAETRPVSVTLDGQAGDGAPGENDAIAADVEGVTGGSGDDVIVGQDGGGTFIGGGGDDHIEARGGDDTVIGGDGRDTIDAGDGADTVIASEDPDIGETPAADSVDCGPGADTLYFDSLDTDVNCETASDGPAPGTGGGSGEDLPGSGPGDSAAGLPVPRGVVLRARRLHGHLVRLHGRLLPPPGIKARGCRGQAVVIRIRVARQPVRLRAAALDGTCRFRRRVLVPLDSRARIRAIYPGSPQWAPARSRAMRPPG